MSNQCRISENNQVIEVFESGKYDLFENKIVLGIIKDCPQEIKPLDWYIDGQFVPYADYKPQPSSQQLTADQLFEYLNFVGVIPKETGYEPRT